MREARRIVLVGVVLSLAVACRDSKLPISGPNKAGFPEIETTLRHKIAQPSASLGATLITSAVVEPSGNTFKGASAGASYRWKEELVLIRQGHPADGFALHTFITRRDVIYETLVSGEVAYLPQVGQSSASAYIVEGDWLINVAIAPSKQKDPVPLEDLEVFVNGLEL
jgi:hypothetical protein